MSVKATSIPVRVGIMRRGYRRTSPETARERSERESVWYESASPDSA